MKRIGVLGTLVWDSIHHPDRGAGDPLEQWGGIAYSLSAFAAACPDGWSICPMVRVGEDRTKSAFEFLSALPSTSSLDGVRIVPEPTNRVELRYLDRAERTERLTGGVSPWPWDEVRPLLDEIDGLFINYISGFELDLATALRVRESFSGLIYADLHSLFLGTPGEGPRQPRALPYSDEWLTTADYVQMNEAELALMNVAGAGLSKAPRDSRPVLLVTKGAQGATYQARASSDESGISEVDVALHHGALEGDPTGCGDVWGAVVCSGILEGRGLEEAMLRGHRAAGTKMRHQRMAGLTAAIRDTLS